MIQQTWRSMTGEQRAQAYSPSSMLDGPLDPYIAQYVARSAQAYREVPEFQTHAYGDRPTQTYDLAVPKGAGAHPCHVFIHGGYWQELSKTQSFFAAPHWMQDGWAFAALDYTLCPDASVDEITDEVCAALLHLRANGARMGIDPARILVSGSSAGAHLAAMATARLPVDQRPAGLCLLSGIYDLEPLIGTYINDALRLDVAAARAVSPAFAVLDVMPPTLLAWGEIETEEFKRQSRDFAQMLGDAGAAVSAIEIAGRNHFDIVFDLIGDTDLTRAVHALHI